MQAIVFFLTPLCEQQIALKFTFPAIAWPTRNQ
jgi:hypothetical protein